MGAPMPPIGGVAPPLTCSRLTSGSFDAPGHCGREAVAHIMWDSYGDNSLVCNEHRAEARRLWTYAGMHDYEMACSMPGAVWVWDTNRCVVDLDLCGLGDLAVTTQEATP